MPENHDRETQDAAVNSDIVSRCACACKRYGPLIAIITVTLIGACIRFYRLSSSGIGNPYYAATVKSMLASRHNFFFAAFEPGGSITVNKAPFAFWLQALSVKTFGFDEFALALPQALAGTVSIPLLYYMVMPYYGKPAGLTAALVLALNPISIAAEREQTVDGLLVFTLLLAALAFIQAIRSGKPVFTILGGLFIGIGFNIDMLQAYIIVPALFLYYFLSAPHSWQIRLRNLLFSAVVLIIVSIWWVAIIDLTASEIRPYIGGSSHNTVLDLVFRPSGTRQSYTAGSKNRFDTSEGTLDWAPGQLEKRDIISGVPANPFLQQKPEQLPQPPFTANPTQPGPVNPPPPTMGPNAAPQAIPMQPLMDGNGSDSYVMRSSPPPASPHPDQISSISQEVGEAGTGRLFSNLPAWDLCWLMPVAILAIPVTLYVQRKWNVAHIIKPLVFWSVWLMSAWSYFSFFAGPYHRYDLVLLAAPLAALCGICVWSLFYTFEKNRTAGIALALLLFTVTFALQISIMKIDINMLNQVLFISGTLFLVGILLLAESLLSSNRSLSHTSLFILLAGLLVAPAYRSISMIIHLFPEPEMPHTGPEDRYTDPANDFISQQQEQLLAYLLENTEAETYLVASSSSIDAANFILETDRPVYTLDRPGNLEQLKDMLRTGSLRFILYHHDLQHQNPDVSSWVIENCSAVDFMGAQQDSGVNKTDRIEQIEIPGFLNTQLYDCSLDE